MTEARESRVLQRMPLIRVSSLIPVVRALDRRGVLADAVLSRHLMTREQLDNPYAEVPLARYIAFLEAAADAAGDPSFGAATGTAFRPSTLGPGGSTSAPRPPSGTGWSGWCRR